MLDNLSNCSSAYSISLVFNIKYSKYGWRYTARETTTKLAIVDMLAYRILVLGHILYSAISGASSTAWDSVAELLTLGVNSSPYWDSAKHLLMQALSGEKRFSPTCRVLQITDKHLELVFGDIKDQNADISKLVVNKKYGSLATGNEGWGGSLWR